MAKVFNYLNYLCCRDIEDGIVVAPLTAAPAPGTGVLIDDGNLVCHLGLIQIISLEKDKIIRCFGITISECDFITPAREYIKEIGSYKSLSSTTLSAGNSYPHFYYGLIISHPHFLVGQCGFDKFLHG